MNVSVVVPTLNEEQNLPTLFEALDSQIEPGDGVVIVDGGSEDSTRDIASDVGAKVIVAEGSTIGKARHIGTIEASNNIIVSMDADSIPPNGYIDRVKEHFRLDEDLVVLWGTVEDKNGVPIRNLTGKFSTIFGGASGNNTSFRKDAYLDMDADYANINFTEDALLIYRLSLEGKAKRDKKLVMRMNMDRMRYQTQPCMLVSAPAMLAGHKIGGTAGNMMKGFGAGMICTEVIYEPIAQDKPNDLGIHHDQIGAAVASIGHQMGNAMGQVLTGIGAGAFIHHAVTEGVSMMPTELMKNTDEVVE